MAPNKKRILIIDDEMELCTLLERHLTRKNYEVHVSHSLDDARKNFTSLLPDIVLADNNLPDGMGWDFAFNTLIPIHNSHLFLISAYSPTLPDNIPADVKYTIIEKPISLRDLDNKLVNA